MEDKVEDIVSKMTLDEKVDQMTCKPFYKIGKNILGYGRFATFNTSYNKHFSLPAIRFVDGPRGANFQDSTAFPVSMARGATWDSDLEERVGRTMGYEMRAKGANYTGAVCINLLYHPSWGRAQETFGEDPYHLGRMGAAMVTGLQEHVMACAKHYAANNIEESRFFVDVELDERTLREVFLPHFKMCVDAGVASFMGAYNKVNGVQCCHSEHLLKDILKNEWGFDGFVISDFLYGVRDTVEAANGGLDIEYPIIRYYGKKLKKAVLKGKVPEENINEAARRIIRQKLRFLPLEDKKYDLSKVACTEHTNLAREVEQKAIVMLKNNESALPLYRNEIKSILVMGKLADQKNLGDKGSSAVRPPYVIKPLDGIRNNAGNVEVFYESGSNMDRAKTLAKKVDAVVVVAGFTWRDEGEYIKELRYGGDRENLGLPKDQVKLIKEISEENDRVIVMIEAGSAVTMESWKDKVNGILMVWYPGLEGGNAMADILFGDVNPSGKTPCIFPKSKDQLPYFSNKVKKIKYERYHGYRRFDKNNDEPAFPFGFGLSYTKYKYDNLKLSDSEINKDGEINISVNVTNSGQVAGEEIVQLYVGYKNPKLDRPVKDLKGFTRTALEPGETKTVTMNIQANDLAYYDTGSKSWQVEQIEYIVYAGPSSNEKDLLTDVFKII